jgi:hypothetical protein
VRNIELDEHAPEEDKTEDQPRADDEHAPPNAG